MKHTHHSFKVANKRHDHWISREEYASIYEEQLDHDKDKEDFVKIAEVRQPRKYGKH